MITLIDKSQGYVIMWRSIVNTPLWSNPKLERVFHWVMYRANWQMEQIFPTTEKVSLHPGQFITSYPHAAIELKMSVGTINTYIKLLKAESIIEINSTNKYTIVTVLNWDELQNPERTIESKPKTKRKQTETDNTINTKNTSSSIPVKELVAQFNALYNTKLLGYGKQGHALKVILGSYTETEMWACAEWLAHDPFWKSKGFDFTTIQSQIAKYKMSLGSERKQEVYRDAKSI